ncbi:SDR family NAD(P)-dependent oxidoreductase [Streptomyces ipomoeae]|uniref:SDR family NAD(P)-dependent oxidoreductase n=1 Tax=Streptomyces ipomoeae TaxID=103232 RepID=UPI00114793C5|nr:SDR family NAD(P)-dependent oxidoreductase [Streptomyces ipomoeae]TQE37625.1 SDR family NAD(P)-dependent oxidoreductase [Streptomyces ipomoeae]
MGLRNTRPIDIGSAHVIVTGGSSGIGLAAARLLAARGAKLSLIARGAERLETAAQEVSATVRRGPAAVRRVSVAVRAADVADRSALTLAIVELEDEQARPCDVLITSAGLARPGLLPGTARRRLPADDRGRLLRHAPRHTRRRPRHGAARARQCGRGVVFPPDVDTPQLAEENRWKPEETRVVGGTIKSLTAEQVAAAIVRGIDQRRFMICPDLGTRAPARFGSVLMPFLNREFDRGVRAVHRSTIRP